MIHPKSEQEFCHPATRLANVPWLCWLVAVALGGFYFYFDEYGHGLYRDIRGVRDYRAEDWCLWLAAMAAAIGIVTTVVGLVVIRRSGGRLRGWYRLSIGMVFNLLAVLFILFTLYVREILKAA